MGLNESTMLYDGSSEAVRRLAAEVMALISALKFVQTVPSGRERMTCSCPGCHIGTPLPLFLVASVTELSV